MAALGKAAGQLVGFGMAANELGIGWASVWVSVWALQNYDSAILVCKSNLYLMCVFMASGGIVFVSSVSVYNGFGLQNGFRDGPLQSEKARGCFFSARVNHVGPCSNTGCSSHLLLVRLGHQIGSGFLLFFHSRRRSLPAIWKAPASYRP